MHGDQRRRLVEALWQVEVAGELHPVVLDIVDVAAREPLVGLRRRRPAKCHEGKRQETHIKL
jgi:hypothetical protein